MSIEIKNQTEITGPAAPVKEIRPGNLPSIFAPHRPKKKTPLQQQPDWVKYALGIALGLAIGGFVIYRYDTRLKPVASVAILDAKGHPISATAITFRMFNDRLQMDHGPSTIKSMVQDELTWQFAKSLGVLPSEKDVDEKLAEAKQQDNYTLLLTKQNMTEDQFKDGIRRNLAIANVAMKGITVTEAEIRRTYDNNTAKDNPDDIFYSPPAVICEAIRTSTQARANEAMAEVESNEDFGLVAQQYSDILGPGGSDVLDPIQLGWSSMPADVQRKLIGLQISQVYGPVYVSVPKDNPKLLPNLGWWIFKCDNTMPEVLLPYSDKKVHKDAELLAKVTKGVQVNGAKIMSDFSQFVQQRTKI